MTSVFCCGFECGVMGAVGQHWTLTGGGTGAIVTASPLSGLRSLQLNPVGSLGRVTSPVLTCAGMVVMRVRVQFAAFPSVDSFVVLDNNSSGSGAWYKVSDGKIYASAGGTLGATGVAVTTGTPYLLDIRSNRTNNPWTTDVSVNGVACGQASIGLAADTTAKAIVLGPLGSGLTFDWMFDDVLVSSDTADFPIGNGQVLGFVPNADGTHTATGSDIVKGTAAAPTAGGSITSATTDAFNWVNARPIGGGATDATRLINQQTVAATEYAEVAFEQATKAPQAVEILVVDQQATTAAGDMHIKVNDNGTETVILDRTGTAGVVTDRFTRKQFALMPTDSLPWTLARFNALKVRFGYSSDATPDQYFRGVMIEADFVILPVAPRFLLCWR